MSVANISQTFDEYADNYSRTLDRGLSLSGEGRDFYARGRLHWTARRLARLDESPRTVLDFGCGDGAGIPHMFDILGVDQIVGIDVSPRSIESARHAHAERNVQFQTCEEFHPAADIDLAFTNGVFHHIAPAQRPSALQQIHAALKPGGLLAFWENNPWNLGTRLIMSRIPFDRDAILVWPREARRLIRDAGFEVLRTDFAFIFPHLFKLLRPLERNLCRLPLGGQYSVLARKR